MLCPVQELAVLSPNTSSSCLELLAFKGDEEGRRREDVIRIFLVNLNHCSRGIEPYGLTHIDFKGFMWEGKEKRT